MFHQYDLYDVEKRKKITKYDDFGSLLSWVAAQEDLEIKTISELVKDDIDLSIDRFINNRYYLQLVHLKPIWWPPYYGIYVPSKTAYHAKIRKHNFDINITTIKNTVYVVAFYSIILVLMASVFFIVGLIIFMKPNLFAVSFNYLSFLFIVILSGYLISADKIEYKKIEVMVAGIGGCLGMQLSFWLFKKKKPARNKKDITH
jgi:hypothetical protein